MISLNQFTLHGTIGHIESREGSGDRGMTTIALYVDDDYKKGEDNDWVDRSYRFPITFFGPQAAGVFASFKKGDEVIITGKLSTGVTENGDKKEYRFYFNGERIFKTLFTVKGGSTSDSDTQSSKAPQRSSSASSRKPAGKSAPQQSKWSKKKAANFVDEEYDVSEEDLENLDFDEDEG